MAADKAAETAAEDKGSMAAVKAGVTAAADKAAVPAAEEADDDRIRTPEKSS